MYGLAQSPFARRHPLDPGQHYVIQEPDKSEAM